MYKTIQNIHAQCNETNIGGMSIYQCITIKELLFMMTPCLRIVQLMHPQNPHYNRHQLCWQLGWSAYKPDWNFCTILDGLL